jgi:protein-disulfide isomerase
MISPRFRTLVDFVTTLAILVTCVIVVSGSWRREPTPTAPPRLSVSKMPPLSLEGASLKGDPKAPVVLIGWTDYECPFCAKVESDALRLIDVQYVKTGRVQVAMRHHPIGELHRWAQKAAEAALCAGVQGKFWEMHTAIFEDQKQISEAVLLQRANALGLSVPSFTRCYTDGSTAAQIQSDADSAKALGLTGTPAFLVGWRQTDGLVRIVVRLSGARPTAEFRRAFEVAEDIVLKTVTEPSPASTSSRPSGKL